jgi:hypothetical protein
MRNPPDVRHPFSVDALRDLDRTPH